MGRLARLAFWRRWRHAPEPVDWLDAATGHDALWWIDFIQRAIAGTAHKSSDPNHDACNTEAWVRQLVREVGRCAPKTPHDENMRTAQVLGTIYVLWFARCAHAKNHDPRRPAALRLHAYRRRQAWAQALIGDAFLSDDQAALSFTQSWDPPYAQDAVDGTFV